MDEEGYKNKIQGLENEIAQMTSNLSINNVTNERRVNELLAQIQGKDIDIKKNTFEYDKKIFDKDQAILGKLSEDYKRYIDEEVSPKKEIWYLRSKDSFVFFFFTVFFSFVFYTFAEGISLDKKISVLSLDLVSLSMVWFFVSQYSYYTKLHTEYSNRRVVANSYLGVIANVGDRAYDLKVEAMRIVTETLFSRSSTESESELPAKEILKQLKSLMSRNNLKAE